jgi:predicted metal-dependent hydrolase
MTTKRHYIEVSDIEVEVVRKSIKNLHLAVYPPKGRVRVAAPLHISDENVRLAVIAKLRWIKKQQADFRDQPRQSQREMAAGESHYFMGRRCRLDVVERHGRHEVVLKNKTRLTLFVKPGTTVKNKEAVLHRWYRQQLKQIIPGLIAKWEPLIGVQVAQWGIKKMKTKWGACNIEAKRIWLNLELAKKPPLCLEYILVHEMAHMLERCHNDRFRAYMDKFMPQWHLHRETLKQGPLGHEDWRY